MKRDRCKFDPVCLPLEHTHSARVITAGKFVLVVAIAFFAGVAATAWFVLLVKGGAL